MLRSALALVFLCSACVAPRSDPAREPLPAGRAADVRYVSRLAIATAPAADADRSAAPVDPRAVAAAPRVRVECAQYRVEASTLGSLVAPAGARAFALVAPRDAVQRVLDARVADGSAQRSARPTLLLRDGAPAEIATTRQQAYVEGFTLTRASDGLVGDPCVATTEEGLSFTVVARLGAAATSVDVALTHTELLRPLLESNVRVPSSGVDVVVQVPLALRQELGASAALGPGEVLVLGGILERDGEHDVLVVVDACREDPGAGGSAPRAAP